MVTDRNPRALREHGANLVDQRLRVLVAADLAPMRMELSSHAQKGNAKRIDVPGAEREMLIPPTCGRQALDFQMRVEVRVVGAKSPPHVTRVEEKRHLWVVLADRVPHPDEIVLD